MQLEDEVDIEVLRRAALVLESENKKLSAWIGKLKKELHELKGGDPEQLKLQIADLERQLATRNKMIFGDSTEKRGSRGKGKEKQTQTTLARSSATTTARTSR